MNERYGVEEMREKLVRHYLAGGAPGANAGPRRVEARFVGFCVGHKQGSGPGSGVDGEAGGRHRLSSLSLDTVLYSNTTASNDRSPETAR